MPVVFMARKMCVITTSLLTIMHGFIDHIITVKGGIWIMHIQLCLPLRRFKVYDLKAQ